MNLPATNTAARGGAFTLLEILAVVAIFALIAGIAMPNFKSLQTRNMKHQAQRLVAQIELARQRSIVTGVPHRLYIDIDGGAYRVEWLEVEEPLTGDRGAGGASGDPGSAFASEDAPLFDDTETPRIDLSAPIAAETRYRPVQGTAGHFVELDDATVFAGVETTGGWVDSGESYIRFERDGSADATTIEIEHESGLTATLDVLPLADNVHVAYGTP